MAVWRTDLSTQPKYNPWNGTAFGTASPSASVGEWRVMAGASSPSRDEAIVVGVDAAGNINGERWNGSTWTALSINPLGSVNETFWWSFDVSYEEQSGDAVLVWADGAALKYSVWNGSTWTTPASLFTYPSTLPRQMQLATKPDADEMVLVVSDSDANDAAWVWNGTNWGTQEVLDGTGGYRTSAYVAYEQQSGHAMAVYGKASDPDGYYRIWNGSTWETEAAISAPVGETLPLRWMTLGVDPSTDRIALGAITEGDGTNAHIWLSVWNGTSWASAFTATTSQTNNVNYPNVAVAFERYSGEALAAYEADISTTSVHYRTWTSSGGWSAQQTGPSLGANGNSKMLTPEPDSNALMLAVQDSDEDLNYVLWDGTGWGTPSEQETETSETKNQPFIFLFRQDTVLPVELTAFDALADGDTVHLSWQTTSETNNAGFEIQGIPKYVGADDRPPEWEVKGFVDGHGTTLDPQTYAYRLDGLTPGRYTFRLKQVDFDGTFEYSPEVEVSVEMAAAFLVEPAYPNPFNPQATLRFSVRQPQAVRVALFDVRGRRVRMLYAGTPATGSMQTVRIDGSGLPSGLYLVRVLGEQFVQTQTVTLVK